MIVDKDLQNLLTTNSMFSGISKEQLKSFIKPKNFIQVEDGNIIYSREEPADEVYLIVQGEVKIKNAERKGIKYKYITDFFGEEEVEKKQSRTSTAIANKDSILYKITANDLNTLVNSISKVKENLISGDNNLIQDFVEEDKSISDEIITNSESEININFDETGEDIKL